MDLARIRAETPGIGASVHLLAAGSALTTRASHEAVVAHLELEARLGGYEAAALRAAALEGVYDSVARLIGARPHEIALVENATVGWQQAFAALPLGRGDRILTCEAEYAANYLAFLQRARRDGVEIAVVPSDGAGAVDLEALDRMAGEGAALIATTWIPTNGGLVNPAAGIGRIARAHGVPYLLDACQAVGQMEVDVETLGCDFLSATGRKFLRGPRGTGFLYVRETWLDRLEPAVIDLFGADWTALGAYRLRDDARRFETWENAYALRAGLGVAADYALALGLDAIRERAWGLAARLRELIAALPGAEIRDIGRERCAIVSFTIDGLDPARAAAALGAQGIVVGTSTPASTLIDAERRRLPTVFRAAPHYYNDESELERLARALHAMI